MAMTHIFLIRAAFVEAWHVRRGEIRKLVVQKRGARRRGPRKSRTHHARLRQVLARVRLPLNRVGLIWIEVRRCFADARPVRTCRVNVAELVLAHRLAATTSSVAVQPPVRRQVVFAKGNTLLVRRARGRWNVADLLLAHRLVATTSKVA